MDSQLWTTLQSLMAGSGAADLEPSCLKRFYTHCAGRPLVHDGRHLSLPLKTLLLNYSHLRAEVKIALDKALDARWRCFAAETPKSPPGVAEERQVPDPVFSPPPACGGAASYVSPVNIRPRREDWFDRFLNGVRSLLFL